VTLIAGEGPSDPPNDGPGATARFSAPTGIVALADGTLLVADSRHHTLRRIAPDAQRTVTTVAGASGQPGFADGAGGAARFSFPMGLAHDPVTGRVLVADNANNRIRALDPSTGAVTTLVGGSGGAADADGPGTSARILQPSALAAAPAPDGRVFIVVTGAYRLKAILPDAARTVVTLAGSFEGYADGTGTEARLEPQGGAVYTNGQVLFSDPGSLTVRALTPGTGPATSTVHTVAGSGRSASSDGPGASASFRLPLGLAASSDGVVYVADAGGGAVRAIRR
jgi:sugar lactone lactonase YvrE